MTRHEPIHAAPVEDTVRMSDGEVCSLPIRYHDGSMISASFSASLPAVRELLGPLPLEPVRLRPGRTIVSIAALEYRRLTDALGRPGTPYQELVVMFPVYREQARARPPLLPLLAPPSVHAYDLYVHQMPVTTDAARALGVEIWGFPKIVAAVELRDAPRSCTATLRVDDRQVLTLSVDKMRTRQRRAEYHNIGVRSGEITRGCFEAQGELGVATFRGGASYTLGEHPIADQLRRLEMGRFAYDRSHSPSFRALLHAPTPPVPASRSARGDAARSTSR